MKTRLNIICFLIFASIIGSVVIVVVREGHDFWWGLKDGSESNDYSDKPNHVYLTLKPTKIGAFTDSVYNAETQKWIPMQYRQVVVDVAEKRNVGILAVEAILALILAFSALIQFVIFIRLIQAIKKSIIFEWSNVWKLRWIGSAMLVSFVSYAIYSYLGYLDAIANISIQNYVIGGNDMWDFYLLIPGLGILLMAEIFAMGLRLREEQELTI